MNKNVKLQYLRGIIRTRLEVGAPAVILHLGGVIHTSPVQYIGKISRDSIIFRTMNSMYCVAPLLRSAEQPHPEDAVCA